MYILPLNVNKIKFYETNKITFIKVFIKIIMATIEIIFCSIKQKNLPPRQKQVKT